MLKNSQVKLKIKQRLNWFCRFEHLDAVLLHLAVVLPELAEGLAGRLLELPDSDGAKDISDFW